MVLPHVTQPDPNPPLTPPRRGTPSDFEIASLPGGEHLRTLRLLPFQEGNTVGL